MDECSFVLRDFRLTIRSREQMFIMWHICGGRAKSCQGRQKSAIWNRPFWGLVRQSDEKKRSIGMSSSGEFSTLSSGEATGTGDDSLPSSREATSDAAGSGFMPLREFLDRFSLPRVVRIESAGGRPILLYKQQQRSLRVTATLLMHRYRHDVKVGPEIVIPEGYPGEFNLFNRGILNLRMHRKNTFFMIFKLQKRYFL